MGCDKSEKGVFISADAQEKAQGQALMMDEALSQPEALSLVEALHSAAEVAKSELADSQTQKTLLSETLTELKKSALLFSAPRDCTGYAQKPAIILRENLISTSGKNTDFSVFKNSL